MGATRGGTTHKTILNQTHIGRLRVRPGHHLPWIRRCESDLRAPRRSVGSGLARKLNKILTGGLLRAFAWDPAPQGRRRPSWYQSAQVFIREGAAIRALSIAVVVSLALASVAEARARAAPRRLGLRRPAAALAVARPLRDRGIRSGDHFGWHQGDPRN